VSAVARLTEEEIYLAVMLEDETGIDLAELTWVDEENHDRCFRIWDFQWKLYHVERTFQIDQMGRALGKTQGIIMRAFAFPFCHPGAEMLITAPELNHLRPITDKIETLFTTSRLGMEMLPKVKGSGINHQPQFQARFVNGARIMSRLPNRDGKGVKGMHPLVIEMDEGQDYPEPGWVEIIETMKTGSPGAQWRVHGVSRGARDMYYKMTTGENPDLPFYVHRYFACHRPSWSVMERKSKIALYGGTEENVDYRRNIFGEHGDAHNPLFVIARLMACVRQNETAWASTYNDEVYYRAKINDEKHRGSGLEIASFLDFPGHHLSDEYVSFWAGADIGYTNDPTEILVAGVVPRKGKPDLMRLLTRIQLKRISAPDQADVFRAVFAYYGRRLRRFGMDKTGNGLSLWQALAADPATRDRIAGYGFSEKLPVEFDDRLPVGKEQAKDLVITKNVIDYVSDQLRLWVDTQALELPYDTELLQELQGQAITVTKDSATGGQRRAYYGSSCHTLDAMRMLAAAKTLETIEATLKKPQQGTPVLDHFGF
jgi:hypothetical protein